MVKKCRALKSYSGQEGRVKRNQVMVVTGKAVPGLVKITLHRFKALQRVGLVEEIDESGQGAGAAPGESRDGPVVRSQDAPKRAVAPDHKKKVDPPAKRKDPPPPKKISGPGKPKPETKPAPAKSEAADDDDPLGSLPGGQSGSQVARPSSSQGDLALSQRAGEGDTPAALTTKPRGKRGNRKGSSGSQ
ncbi:hypothetical protein TVVG_00029 [Tetraselmis viridis virus SI1]|uniref:hypothetical protein n=1 Tax=Tetraselmis viridis virus S20 TaxID=754070 RepID=UPI0002C13D3A|nr:hypothetical protein TVGG_00050 [Tetraselmis viridis virus S20]AGH31378.1 hypothetical protein TVGG_00050 [Tetraselmis viridis virus S20]AGH31412.1 hypothetical protein TVVG_00029 [Tetraselmis viridis virus SI1]